MKQTTIAFLHDQFPIGGAEKMTLVLADELRQRGMRTVVLCKNFHPELMPEDSHIHVIQYRHKTKKLKSADEIIDYIKKEKIQVLTFVVWAPHYVNYIRQNTNCKIVFANHGMPFWEAASKKDKKRRLAFGKTIDRLKWYFYYHWKCDISHAYDKKVHERYRKCLTEVDAYTVLCEAYRDEIADTLQLNRSLRDKIYVIPNYQEPNEHPQLEKEKVVLFVGRLTYADKRVDRLLRIWKRVEEQVPEWRLEIVGDGDEEENLKTQAAELQLTRVKFEGRQQPQPYYDRAAIFCLTSSSEGWGLVITEAQTNGVVPIAFACSAGTETLISPSGINGILVAPFDEEEYSEQLLKLIQDESLRLSIQHNILKKKYPRNDVCQRYMQLYEELLKP